jgi:glycosyltransferase involved in cell wall biosynthesis
MISGAGKVSMNYQIEINSMKNKIVEPENIYAEVTVDPPFLSIVAPVYNEEESIGKLIERIKECIGELKLPYEIIAVDDGSSDGTWAVIENLRDSIPNLIGIKLRRNFGQTSAMVAGFEHSRGQVIVTMDADLQNDPADIPALLDKMSEGYDIVSGWRKDRKDHWSRVWPSRVANGLISMTTGVHLHDYGCSLKAYRSECIKAISAYGEMHRFFPALARMTGARVTEIPVTHHPRRYGKSKYGFDRIFKVFSDIFSMNLIIRFSSKPLKGFVLCSLPFMALTGFLGMLCLSALFFDWTAGKAIFFFFAAALSGMAVVHLLFLGILCELVVGQSDLAHTQMPELTKKSIDVETDGN